MFIPDFEPNDMADAEEARCIRRLGIALAVIVALIVADALLIQWAGW